MIISLRLCFDVFGKGRQNDTGFWLSCWRWSSFLRFTIEYSYTRFSCRIYQIFLNSGQKHCGVCTASSTSLGCSLVPCLLWWQDTNLLLEWIMASCLNGLCVVEGLSKMLIHSKKLICNLGVSDKYVLIKNVCEGGQYKRLYSNFTRYFFR